MSGCLYTAPTMVATADRDRPMGCFGRQAGLHHERGISGNPFNSLNRLFEATGLAFQVALAPAGRGMVAAAGYCELRASTARSS